MRTFLGSQKTPNRRAKTSRSHAMADAAEQTDDANTTVASSLGIRDMVREEEEDSQGTPVLWGDFQGTQQNGAGRDSDWCQRGVHGCRPEESWVAFRDADSEDTRQEEQEVHTGQHGGRWWCEDSTVLCARENSVENSQSSVEHIFDQCFPIVSHPPVEEDIQPLELLLQDGGSEDPKRIWRRSVGCPWGNSSHTRDPDELYKFKGSQLCSTYLSSLHIDPNDKVPPHRHKFPASSPAPKQRPQPHKLSAGLGRESELKLTKVASVSVHVTGFSPSHHLQSLFQHWSQPNGKARLKVAYDFNRGLLA